MEKVNVKVHKIFIRLQVCFHTLVENFKTIQQKLNNTTEKVSPADSDFSQKVSLNSCAKLTQLLGKEIAELRQLRLKMPMYFLTL